MNLVVLGVTPIHKMGVCHYAPNILMRSDRSPFIIFRLRCPLNPFLTDLNLDALPFLRKCYKHDELELN